LESAATLLYMILKNKVINCIGHQAMQFIFAE
jgi:hypothetical protein